MKNITTSLGLLIFLIIYGNTNAQNTTTNSKDLLNNIQQKIHTTFGKAQKNNNLDELEQLDDALTQLYKEKKQNIILYWRAYNQYYMSIYQLTKGNKKLSEKHIDQATKWLIGIQNKTSEDYALLSLTQGFAIQFKNMLKMIFLSKQIGKNGKLAIEKDSKNLRGYYALASSDFYRPEQYGGGKQVEELLLKAITLPSQKIKNTYLPSWGKQEAYEMLIRWYIRKEKLNAARKYHKEAIQKYPHNYSLQQLTPNLK